MNLDFPLTPEKIREGMNEIISEIRKETNWDLMRNLSDITITIGDAPEYFESFGVSRSSQDLIFGEWLEKLEPDYTKESLVEYLIIRESFSLFFKESLLFSEIRMLTDFFLNILTVSFIKNKFEGRSFDIVVGFAKARFLFKKNDITNFDIQFLIKMDELVTSIINQGISYTLIFNTYLFFIEDIPFNEINIDEVLIDFSRYLAVSSLEIAAPIQFNESIIKTLEKLVELGYQTSITELAKTLDVNTATISRQLTQISSRYRAKWQIERNWPRLGLHAYLVIIRLNKQNKQNMDFISDRLIENGYLREIHYGEGAEYLYIYSVVHCPHILIENLGAKFEKYTKDEIIASFEFKLITNKIYNLVFTKSNFQSSISEYKKLFSDKKDLENLTVWKNQFQVNDEKIIFSKKDIPILRLLSILISNSIVGHGLYGVAVPELRSFLEDYGIDFNNTPESILFFNKLYNKALDLDLMSFRLTISLSNIITSNFLVIWFKDYHKNNPPKEFLDKILVFGWTLQLELNDGYLIVILGPKYDDPLSEIIIEELKSNKIEFFSIFNKTKQFVPYEKLYDFKEKKWILG